MDYDDVKECDDDSIVCRDMCAYYCYVRTDHDQIVQKRRYI